MLDLFLPPSQLVNFVQEDVRLRSLAQWPFHHFIGKPVRDRPQASRDSPQDFQIESHEEDFSRRNGPLHQILDDLVQTRSLSYLAGALQDLYQPSGSLEPVLYLQHGPA